MEGNTSELQHNLMSNLMIVYEEDLKPRFQKIQKKYKDIKPYLTLTNICLAKAVYSIIISVFICLHISNHLHTWPYAIMFANSVITICIYSWLILGIILKSKDFMLPVEVSLAMAVTSYIAIIVVSYLTGAAIPFITRLDVILRMLGNVAELIIIKTR